LTAEIAQTLIFPAAVRYQNELADSATKVKALGLDADTSLLQELVKLTNCLQESVAALEAASEGAHHVQGLEEEALYLQAKVLPAMLQVRNYADKLEGVVADDLWPLPTYQEMLFIK
jgi:glutamine synthetase